MRCLRRLTDSPSGVGTRYESGQNVFEGIRRFGEQNRLFHVHFRNVVGTIPENKGYMEVIPDAGDMNMYDVAKALYDVGYEGCIDYDHIMRLSTDGPRWARVHRVTAWGICEFPLAAPSISDGTIAR